ncbi:MAG: ABC transporter ATP-binding protein [Actinomycetota bacterium]
MQTLKKTQQTQSPIPLTESFLEIDGVSKVYQTTQGPYQVLEDVNLTVKAGEFVCIIGHSGCGKSTLLNMVAGFNQPTAGEVRLQGQRITEPGPDRMVVFQNYSLLPWMSAAENIRLGVETVFASEPVSTQQELVKEHLEMVGLGEAADKKPGQLSGGMKQRVAIARALAIRPQVLILDEPFGALDPITREELQEELLKIWREHRCTVLMITHDIDEALFLADKVVMMTNGPAAKIGEVLEIPFSRPRVRSRLIEDPRYYELRNHALDFLFNRFAHDETSQSAEPVVAQPAPQWLLKASVAVVATAAVGLAGWGVARWVGTAASGKQNPGPAIVAAPNPAQPKAEIASPPKEITDPAQREELKWKLYDSLEQNWRVTPTFSDNLIYQVKVTADGAIASYEPSNQLARDYLRETPLPNLTKVGSNQTVALASFEVVFAPNGTFLVSASATDTQPTLQKK